MTTELAPIAPITEADETIHVTEGLIRNVVFVMVSVHLWRGQYKIKEALVKLANAELQKELITDPRWNLMPQQWRSRFTAVESRITNVITQATVVNPEHTQNGHSDVLRFPLRGVHILPRKSLPKFFADIKAIEQTDFRPLVAAFAEAWPETIQQIKEKTAGQPPVVWATIAKHLPISPADVTARFWLEKMIIPITLGHTDSLMPVCGEDVEEYTAELKAYGEAFTQQAADMIIQGLEGELKAAVDNLTNRITEGGVIKEGTLNMVRTAFEKFQAFDFLMTPQLKSQMSAASFTLGEYNCQELNKDLKDAGANSVTMRLSQYLKEVREKCVTDMATARVHGRKLRNVRV